MVMVERWTEDDDGSAARRARERHLWLIAARVLIPINALIVGWLIGQAL